MADFVGLGILMIAAGSAAIGTGRKIIERRRARRELREKLPLSAGSAEGEVVRVTGVVRVLDDTLTAPLSQRECVVVRSRVRPGRKMTDRAQRPKELIAMVPFVIDRGADGRVVVEGKHVLLDLDPLKLDRKDIDLDRRDQFLVAQGLPLRESGRAVYDETLVAPGDRISVAGLMMKDVPMVPDSEELGFRDAARPNLRLAGNVEHPLVIGEPVD